MVVIGVYWVWVLGGGTGDGVGFGVGYLGGGFVGYIGFWLLVCGVTGHGAGVGGGGYSG